MGGLLINAFGWPAVFAFMAAFGAAAFVLGSQVFPSDVAKEPKHFTFDLPGMMVLAFSLGAYALSTTLGGATPGMSNMGLGLLALIGMATFVAIEHRTTLPLVQLAVLRDRALAAGLVSMALVSTNMLATLVVGPFYLSGILGLSPVQSGFAMSVGPGVSALTGFPAGRLVDRFGEATVPTPGCLVSLWGQS